MPKKVEITTNEARQATTRPKSHDLGAVGIAFPLCDGGVGADPRLDQSAPAVPVTLIIVNSNKWLGGPTPLSLACQAKRVTYHR